MNAHLTRTAKAIVVALVTTVALAGCLKVDFDLQLQPDDTVDGSITYAVAEGTGEAMSSEDEVYSDEDLLEMLFGDMDASEYANGALSDYREDEWIGKTISFEGEELAGFALDESSDGLTIVREGDEFVVSGPYDSGDELTEGTEGAEMTLSITFPGEVSSHNGTLSDDGRTVTWDLLNAPDSLDARGSATEGGGSFPWLIVVLVLVGIAVIGGVVGALLVTRRRSSSEPEGYAPPLPEPAAEGSLDTLFPSADAAPETAPARPQEEAPEPEAPAEPAAPQDTDGDADTSDTGDDKKD
ncbi:LppM family (lipo)protein [Demequina zhanjiangensis]|uniref:LppM domain-containing protein n=1 Tax=Demequina zhanjiangensis TaxID=3051659 RepID=A0ABT8FZK7_9MICO|nr:hypothetical protein [Demequina sp. SYSU T00b26]MDN4472292.1 hypothetical protein [Demequina sp. SYSU T00b26]